MPRKTDDLFKFSLGNDNKYEEKDFPIINEH